MLKNISLLLLLFSLSIKILNASEIDYDTYNKILHEYVSEEGRVNYSKLKRKRSDFDAFVAGFNQISQEEFNSFSKKEKLAFWINAYNAFTLKVIIDNYPIKKTTSRHPEKSIRQIPGVWKKIKFDILGERITLSHIEHEILRRQFNEPRIHFAINCASVGCPVIRKEVYLAEKLDKQLDEQVNVMLKDKSKFLINKNKNIIYVSSIFDWFGKDFIEFKIKDRIKYNKTQNGILSFIYPYLSESDQNFIIKNKKKLRIKYLDYDWSLNEQRSLHGK